MLANHPNVLGGGATTSSSSGGTGLFADGAAAAPSISFLADQDTGIYRIGANNLGVAAGGAKVLDIVTGQLTLSGSGADCYISTIPISGNVATFGCDATGQYTYASAGLGIRFRTNGGTTALTLSSAQAATFAGAIAVSGAATFAVGATTSTLTDILVNPTTKTSGNLIDAQVNSASKFSVSYTGSITLPAGGITMDLGVTVGASARITWLGSTELSSANGTLTVQNSANTAGFILNGTTDDTLMLRKRSDGTQDAALTAGAGTFSGAVKITGNVGFYWQPPSRQESPSAPPQSTRLSSLSTLSPHN